jgi:hypothetical protein
MLGEASARYPFCLEAMQGTRRGIEAYGADETGWESAVTDSTDDVDWYDGPDDAAHVDYWEQKYQATKQLSEARNQRNIALRFQLERAINLIVESEGLLCDPRCGQVGMELSKRLFAFLSDVSVLMKNMEHRRS